MLDKVKGIIKKIDIDGIRNFLVKNKRYIGAAGVFVLMICILAVGTDGSASSKNPMAGAYQSYEENEDQKLLDLITNYYNAYAAGDVETLQKYATPVSASEQSYIQNYSQFIEKYQNIKLYTKRGIDENAYLVSAYLQIKFNDIDTPVAGLDFFYVETDENGNLYINNTYGLYNQNAGEYQMDSSITALIAAFEQQEDVLALQAQVQQECNEAMLADEKLSTFVNSTLQQSITKWATDYKAQVAAEEAAKKEAEQKAAEEAKKAEEEKAAAEAQAAADAQEAANAKQGTINASDIHVRDAASSDGNSLGKVNKGDVVTVYSVENGWAKIDFNGTKAYVSADFIDVSDASASTTTTTTTTDNASTGTDVVLSDTVNVRANPDSSSQKVAMAYKGDTITVLEDAGNGWSKVSYKGQAGYCKTEYLK